MPLITKQSDLNKICNSIEKDKIAFIDTEFAREKTFFPVLCLIQINVDGVCFAIDVLEDEIDLSPLVAILNNPKIIKVFHSMRQDLEVLALSLPEKSMQIFEPQSIFDTQIMSALCGLGFTISYQNLTKNLLEKDVAKEWQRSDWQSRPLHPDQISYAKIDVLHLPGIYQILKEKLTKENKLQWLEKEMDLNVKKSLAADDLLKNFSFAGKSASYQENVEILVSLRNAVARELNVPRSFVFKDDVLSKIAFVSPSEISDFEKCSFKTRVSRPTLKAEMIKLLKQKPTSSAKKDNPRIDTRLSEEQKENYQKSRLLLQECAEKHQINPELIINQSNLICLISGNKLIADLLPDWRYEVFGKELKNLIC